MSNIRLHSVDLPLGVAAATSAGVLPARNSISAVWRRPEPIPKAMTRIQSIIEICKDYIYIFPAQLSVLLTLESYVYVLVVWRCSRVCKSCKLTILSDTAVC